MPPVIIVVVGVIGAVAAAKWITREARRINAELHPGRFDTVDASEGAESAARLRRDSTGVYRPD